MENKAEVLGRIYLLHEQYTREHGMVCEKGCSACCTCNVTLTSLEYAFMVNGMGEKEKKRLEERALKGRAGKRFQPGYTINNMAALCLAGQEPPEEENDPAWGTCPLLREDMCTIYETRPLACRMLLSQVQCRQLGYAQMPPLVLTLNNLFMQVVEHLDARGISGNLTDMILWHSQRENEGTGDVSPLSAHLINNSRAPVFMVPPEHREQLGPLMAQLSSIMADQQKR
ncbi:YkgJ family cysteine cluster protein [Desulfocicer niacini]